MTGTRSPVSGSTTSLAGAGALRLTNVVAALGPVTEWTAT